MKRWHIEGGEPLRGHIEVAGAKNVVVKLMIATLLAKDETTLTNVPDVGDVESVGEMISLLGGEVDRLGPNSITICPQDISKHRLPRDLAQKSRASTMFAGPLLARYGEAILPMPGGDRIGRRPLNWHFDGLKKLNVEVRQEGDVISLRTLKLKGGSYRFPKNTHTGTETLILAAALAEGQTVLENAAQEPEVDDLIAMLNGMGAHIQRTSARTIVIKGVTELSGTTYEIMSDRNEQVSFSCMALATKGDLWVAKTQPEYLQSFLQYMVNTGAGMEVESDVIHIWYQNEKLRPLQVKTQPHPGFMTDWQPLLTTLLTQADGVSTVHETVFDRRFDFVDELIEMGAKIELMNPTVKNPEAVYNFSWQDRPKEDLHAARIYGPTQLHGIRVHVTDVRAGASLVQAALMAEGETQIVGVDHVERGYERLVPRLKDLGANIQSVVETNPE
ncbi:UDP-N-acetylglucosamine 1-carboxyvinyltransferase [bacterium]|nr:UDP-N-acetylglucosamine 1-carboxyvinyltransferase [bacterium]